ncbi:regulator [Cronobacter sakazakii]|uniref:regulator n=1 Tax=Cronobacter sakazakii TaxID=28141 RepID=UPI000DA1103D|nr:regulator [Cronobacter sakazakii]MCZ6108420.1 regulator [Cronobacter sakazakii]MCZ6113152.1 regulator [Cronobacter sakazakii]MCZ6130120.1 regulator [Cronobacter sakazakii]MCZ6137442.1 regulator [Cronobacter sakazakii]MCZ6425312.1 regulator [Cronobacter sakazakii]
MKSNFSMRPSINLVVSEPFITLDEFCRRTGYKPSYARQMIRENRLPIRKKAGVNSLIEINMFALTMEAAQGCEVVMQA